MPLVAGVGARAASFWIDTRDQALDLNPLGCPVTNGYLSNDITFFFFAGKRACEEEVLISGPADAWNAACLHR